MRLSFLSAAFFGSLAICTARCKYSLHLLGRGEEPVPAVSVAAPLVIRTVPAEYATGIGTNAKVHVGFDSAMTASTLTVNTVDTACSGSVQLSANDFVTCIRMASAQVAVAGTFFSVTPAANLAANTRYRLRITAAAQSARGIALGGYDSAYGFTTASGIDSRPPVVQTALATFVSPFDTAANVPVNTGVTVYFSEPVDPTTLTVNTADTNCSGNIQLSQDLFVSCVRMSGPPAVAFDGRIFSVFPAAALAASTAHRIRVTTGVRDLSGNAISSALVSNFTTDASANSSSFSVTSATPANGSPGVSISPPINIAFTASRFLDAATVTFNSVNSACSGSIQLSADNFASCVALAMVSVGADFESVGLRVLTPLQNAATYKIRVTAGLKDIYGNAITAFTQASGFTTTATVTGGGTVSFLEPGDNSAASNDLYSAFTVNFSRVMNPATLTAITAGSACTASFSVSADNFVTCLPMSAQPVASSGNTRFTVFPQTPLTASGVYRTRISTAAQDGGGAAVTLFTGNGITIMP